MSHVTQRVKSKDANPSVSDFTVHNLNNYQQNVSSTKAVTSALFIAVSLMLAQCLAHSRYTIDVPQINKLLYYIASLSYRSLNIDSITLYSFRNIKHLWEKIRCFVNKIRVSVKQI